MAIRINKKLFAIGFTVLNIILLFFLLVGAVILPMGMGRASYDRLSFFFIVFTWVSPVSVPIGIYKGWKSIHNPSIKPFLLYHFLPIICFSIVILFSSIVAYWIS
jgi:hypothetical protein